MLGGSSTATATSTEQTHSASPEKIDAAIEFAHQAERLGQYTHAQEKREPGQPGNATQAVKAHFVTGQDPVIETANGGRLPAVPLEEAAKLNHHKDVLEGRDPKQNRPVKSATRKAIDGSLHGIKPLNRSGSQQSGQPDAPLREAIPPFKTNPLFPPLPMYGPPTLMRNIQCWLFRISSAILSFCFLAIVALGAVFTSIPVISKRWFLWMTFRNPEKGRPFFEEERQRKKLRKEAEKSWKRQKSEIGLPATGGEKGASGDEYVPTEGGPDPLVCDVSHYARRVGLDSETFKVQTEDGFVIELWHIYNPREYNGASKTRREHHAPHVFQDSQDTQEKLEESSSAAQGNRRYPILMMHGLLQSSGAYCCNDEDSFAFYLAKSGYDVWLGNNRCGFKPKHTMLDYNDPRMWAWNIRQMGVLDLPALISRVLTETGFPKLALVAHSQGTTETLVALAKEQRPEIGDKISVFCALAPAAYAGPLIGKAYFKFMRNISPAMFRAIFGIHAFIPLMMVAHKILPGGFYGRMGYLVFSFLFNWTDERWERDLRNRMFQFAPVYISAESMRWWLGRECFAKQKCILATREEKNIEDREDAEEDEQMHKYYDEDIKRIDRQHGEKKHSNCDANPLDDDERDCVTDKHDEKLDLSEDKRKAYSKRQEERAQYAWYGPPVPPIAMWVCGNDALVDGRRLLRRFERGREPHVQLVHTKIIEEYEHLDVIWAMDAIEKVASEVREVIWKTVPEGPGGRLWCRTPKGCENIGVWTPPEKQPASASVAVDASAGKLADQSKISEE